MYKNELEMMLSALAKARQIRDEYKAELEETHRAKEYLEKIVVPSDAEIYVEEGMDSIPLVDIMVDFAQQQIEGARYEYSVRMPNHALIGDDTKVIERIINGNAEAGIEYVGQYGRFVVYRRRILDGERKPNNG